MVDMFNKIVLKVIAAKLTRDVGWLKIRNRPLEVMTDALHRFMKDISIKMYRYTEFSGRTEPSLNDINLVLQDLNINVSELEKYKSKTKSVSTIHISQYPVPSPDELTLPHVLNDLDSDDVDITELNDENGSIRDDSPDVGAKDHSLVQNDFDANSGRRKEQSAVSFSKDECEKLLEVGIGENANEMEELDENNKSSVPKRKRKKRRKKEKPEYIVSCTSKTTQSVLKTDEMNVFGRERKDEVTSAMTSKDITTVSDKLHIRLDFPKIIIKRLKAENVKCENSNTRKLSGACEETNVSVQQKNKRKLGAKKVRNTKKSILTNNINHKSNEKISAFLF